jgi:hypothetical protein
MLQEILPVASPMSLATKRFGRSNGYRSDSGVRTDSTNSGKETAFKAKELRL